MSRRSEALPFTLTEILVFLFFLLTLALVEVMRDRLVAEEEVEKSQELVEAVAPLGPDGTRTLVELIRGGRESFPEDFRELVLGVKDQARLRARLRSRLDEAGVDPSFLATASADDMLNALLTRHAETRAAVEALERVSSLPDSVRQVVEEMAAQVGSLESEAQDLRGQMAFLRERVGNGLDHPPCWPDEQGRPEYAFEVTLRTGRVDVRAIWPGHRAEDARRTPGMTALPGEDLTLPIFRGRAAPVLAMGRRQIPECRHFVRIVDRVDGGKEAFKEGLLTVEDFFYKLLTS